MPFTSIIAKNITALQFGKTVLEDISFAIEEGQHLAIIGSSGSGKSSLAKALAGRLFTKGAIETRYNEQSTLQPLTVLVEPSETLKNLSNVSDFYYQQRYNSCDAEDALTVGQELQKTTGLSSDLNNLLQLLNLSHRLQTPLIQLSNGEQKKLQLIKALVQRPQVLILDNVFIGLDRNSRSELHDIIDRLAIGGSTVILVTDERELSGCITHIAELHEGKLIQFGEREDFVPIHADEAEEKNRAIPSSLLLRNIEKYDSIIRMKDVTIQYGNKIILQNINWNVKQGEHWLVKGHNGAGKSTLLSLITADNPQAYSQEIYLFGRSRGSGESIWDIKKKIGFVSPELHKFFDMNATVRSVIASGLFDTMGLFRSLNPQQEQMVNEWLQFFDLNEQRDKPLFLLSTSQQRKAMLARALIKNPVLLVLDEPCQGLDSLQTKQFLQLVNSICEHATATLIYVSHYDNEIPACITKKLELHEGTLINLYKPKPITV